VFELGFELVGSVGESLNLIGEHEVALLQISELSMRLFQLSLLPLQLFLQFLVPTFTFIHACINILTSIPPFFIEQHSVLLFLAFHNVLEFLDLVSESFVRILESGYFHLVLADFGVELFDDVLDA